MSDFFEVSPHEDGVDPEQLMDSVAKWATRHTKLSPAVKEQLKDILKSHANRLEVFVHIAADQRAKMLARLFPWSDRIDRELFDPRRIQNATTEELLRLAEGVNRRIEGHTSFLKDLIDEPQPQFVQETEREIRELTSRTGALAALPPERREDLRSLLLALAQQVGNDGVTNSQSSSSSAGPSESAGP